MTLTRIITNKHIGLTCIPSPLFISVFNFLRVLVGFPPLFHLLIFPANFPSIYLLDFLILTFLLKFPFFTWPISLIFTLLKHFSYFVRAFLS